jgi:hypothetical protein
VAIFIGVPVLGPMFAKPTSMIIGALIAKLKGITGDLARERGNRRRDHGDCFTIGVALCRPITVFAASVKRRSARPSTTSSNDYIIQSGVRPRAGLANARPADRRPSAGRRRDRCARGSAGINNHNTQLGGVDRRRDHALRRGASADRSTTRAREHVRVSKRKAEDNH